MDLGPHAHFIWLCYGVVALVVGGLITALWLDGRRYSRALADLEGNSRAGGGSDARRVD